jgi:TrmH family RNA methyltransferase
MIPLEKIEKLPRRYRLRKTAKIFGKAENTYIVSGKLNEKETEYLVNVLSSLIKNEGFAGEALDVLEDARSCIKTASGTSNKEKDKKDIRRALNGVYHILLAETGIYPADWDFVEPSGSLDSSKRQTFPGIQIYLEDIRSPFNVGSIFRAAESFGVEKIWLSPLCADPRHKRAERTAMGCVDILPWKRLNPNPFDKIEINAGKSDSLELPFLAGPFFALETGGIPLADFTFPSRGIMIAGSEELGVSPGALAVADDSLGRVSIPNYGAKASLNVSVALGIAMQAWAAALCKR